ncbi:mannosylinositol phosphorylceramide synthase catalytic subunit SUR1 [Sugiyamaella lignohabitans]|uniref:Mannosylinositol phosphorylceramide synthase catalytic subunit SUR1 n=1 Tax=Sugiyamaella lignohabitans TaxID=796027 RepID=A0A167FY83_9ASCO|nr:mannosylinositol phosphorylceramide synthase catalytic subunit SUR1 [Sugiyamaella lignohabitans]ANB15855.1 mannosylinositol phosphorylceramide synthase catalytic subunit SUR1 [Sugiyamaella lignohabitans]
MRKDLKLMLIVNGLIVLFLITQVFDLMTLLIDDSFKDAIVESELTPVKYTKQADGEETPDRKLIVPKIIHQTYKNETIPEPWLAPQKSVRDLHPDFEYILWTDETARNFIKEHYDWFLPTYDNYPYPIMRADVMRYFILYHYGGVYIDLDNGCDFRIDPLLAFPAWLRKTVPTGVSNDIMGAVPKHPFFLYVIDNLQRYNHNWLVSYITIMYSTGPLMLSVVWKRYKRWGVPNGGQVRILVPPDHKTHMTYFFFTAQGSSWHLGDAKFIMSMGKHWIFYTFLGTALVISVFYLQFKFYQFLLSGSFTRFYRKSLRRLFPNSQYKDPQEDGQYELVPGEV